MVLPVIVSSQRCEFLYPKIVRSQLDRRAVRRALAGALPGVARAAERRRVGEALLSDDALERGQPVMVISLAGIWIAGGLRLLDLVAQRRRPFLPGEQAALVERQRQSECFRFPRLAENRPVADAGAA